MEVATTGMGLESGRVESRRRKCLKHKQQAGWQCCDCGKFLCVQCARPLHAGARPIVGCGECGGLCVPLLRLRRFPPVHRLIADVVSYPLKGYGALVIASGGFIITNARLLSPIGAGVTAMVAGIYLLLAEEGTARGEPTVPPLTDFPRWRDCASAFFVGLRATVVIALPAATYSVVRGLYPSEAPDAVFSLFGLPFDNILISLVGLSLLFWPPIWLLAAAWTPGGPSIGPVRELGVYRRIGLPAALLLPLFGAAIFVHVDLAPSIDFHYDADAPSNVIADALCLYIDLVVARAAGLILQIRGAAIGYGRQGDQFEPILAMPKNMPAATPQEIAEFAARPAAGFMPRSISLPDVRGKMELDVPLPKDEAETDPGTLRIEPAPTIPIQKAPPRRRNPAAAAPDLVSEKTFHETLGIAPKAPGGNGK